MITKRTWHDGHFTHHFRGNIYYSPDAQAQADLENAPGKLATPLCNPYWAKSCVLLLDNTQAVGVSISDQIPGRRQSVPISFRYGTAVGWASKQITNMRAG